MEPTRLVWMEALWTPLLAEGRLTMIPHGTTSRALPPTGRLALLVLTLILLPLVHGRVRPPSDKAAPSGEEEPKTVETRPQSLQGLSLIHI